MPPLRSFFFFFCRFVLVVDLHIRARVRAANSTRWKLTRLLRILPALRELRCIFYATGICIFRLNVHVEYSRFCSLFSPAFLLRYYARREGSDNSVDINEVNILIYRRYIRTHTHTHTHTQDIFIDQLCRININVMFI